MHTFSKNCLLNKKEPYSSVLAFIMLPLISPQYCLSSAQLPHCQPTQLLPLPFSCYSGQAKPQLSHMTCLLDVWTKLGGNEAKTDLLSESDPVRRDCWNVFSFDSSGNRDGKQMESDSLIFSRSWKWPAAAAEQGLGRRCSLPVFRAVQWSVSWTQWKEPLNPPCSFIPVQSQPETIAQPVQKHCQQLGRPAHTTMTWWVIGR